MAVVGKAVYRPSGNVLRIDASHVEASTAVTLAFSRVPPPMGYPVVLPPQARMAKPRKAGVAAFFGTWPGEETDEELLRAVREVRG